MQTSDKFKARTREFACDVICLCLALQRDDLGVLIRPQLLRAATGVACNYRAACRSRSAKEFASRLGIVIEEADEAEFWLDMLATHARPVPENAEQLRVEAIELRAIFVRSRMTVMANLDSSESRR